MEAIAVCGKRRSKQVSNRLVQKARIEYTYIPRMIDEQITLDIHLRSIRTAVVAMAVSILATGLIIADESGLGFPPPVIALFVCGYALLPTLLFRLCGH
jgi:hypothetical protein